MKLYTIQFMDGNFYYVVATDDVVALVIARGKQAASKGSIKIRKFEFESSMVLVEK